MVKIKVENINSFWKKTKGLIGQKNYNPVYFETRFGIHTFGLKEKIDVTILDNQNKVVCLKTVAPNRFFLWNPVFFKVIEMPYGSIKKLNIENGSIIQIIF